MQDPRTIARVRAGLSPGDFGVHRVYVEYCEVSTMAASVSRTSLLLAFG